LTWELEEAIIAWKISKDFTVAYAQQLFLVLSEKNPTKREIGKFLSLAQKRNFSKKFVIAYLEKTPFCLELI
jgi:hypothetical protein